MTQEKGTFPSMLPPQEPSERMQLTVAVSRPVVIDRLAGRWSLNYDRCQECGTRTFPHEARGRCLRCYVRAKRGGVAA